MTISGKPLVRLSLRHLALIAAIDDSGSLKRAAERITMSQPRATKALQEAEALAGKKLFTRTNRGLVATPAGDCMIRNAKAMLAQLGRLERELGHMSAGAWSRLRIGTIMGAVPIVSEAIRRHLLRYPQTSFEIVEDSSAELLRQLDRGLLDLVVGRSLVSATPERYDVTSFHGERLSVVANPAHPLVGLPHVTLHDLSASRWIVYEAEMPMRMTLEKEYRLANLPFPQALLETRSALATMSLIQGNHEAVALLSTDVAAFFTQYGMATTLPLEMRTGSDPYEIITRKARDLPENTAYFMDNLTSVGRHLPPERMATPSTLPAPQD